MNIKQLKSGNARELFRFSVGDPSRKGAGVRHTYLPPAQCLVCHQPASPPATCCHTFTHLSFIATHGAALSAGAAPLSAHDRIVPQLARFPNADITRRWPGMICCRAASAGMADSTTLSPRLALLSTIACSLPLRCIIPWLLSPPQPFLASPTSLLLHSRVICQFLPLLLSFHLKDSHCNSINLIITPTGYCIYQL